MRATFAGLVHNRVLVRLVDLDVPFGPFLRDVEGRAPFALWSTLVFRVLPTTFFFHWLFTLLGSLGSLFYAVVLVAFSAWIHIVSRNQVSRELCIATFLWYFIVIVGGYGGLRNFIGHFFLSDYVARSIGWVTGSPFQVVRQNFSPGNAGSALYGNLLLSTILIVLWFLHVREQWPVPRAMPLKDRNAEPPPDSPSRTPGPQLKGRAMGSLSRRHRWGSRCICTSEAPISLVALCPDLV